MARCSILYCCTTMSRGCGKIIRDRPAFLAGHRLRIKAGAGSGTRPLAALSPCGFQGDRESARSGGRKWFLLSRAPAFTRTPMQARRLRYEIPRWDGDAADQWGHSSWVRSGGDSRARDRALLDRPVDERGKDAEPDRNHPHDVVGAGLVVEIAAEPHAAETAHLMREEHESR